VQHFPILGLSEWRATRDSLHQYARINGAIRQSLAPARKHSWHLALRAAATGITTGPLQLDGRTFSLSLDFARHQQVVTASDGGRVSFPLRGQSVTAFFGTTVKAMRTLDIRHRWLLPDWADDEPGAYDPDAVARYWQVTTQVHAVLGRFQSELREETSPVQLWPHHFDLAMNWFSGRRAPDTDLADAQDADEQMTFGFSTGDAAIDAPYFYVTAYPTPEAWLDSDLLTGASWHREGWTGAVYRYADLIRDDDPMARLLEFFRATHASGSALMQ